MMQSLIVESLAGCPDLTFVEDGEADVVLMPAGDEAARDYMQLLWRFPRSRVVVVAPSGELAVMYELFPRQEVLGDLCPATLLEAIAAARVSLELRLERAHQGARQEARRCGHRRDRSVARR
jgi:hypothetical protein